MKLALDSLRADNKYGLAVTADVEVLAYAMKFVKKQGDVSVCEIGCAHGENGILLACAGAKQVVFNDIDEGSIQAVRNQIKQLPQQVQSACKVDQGDCFDLLDRNPELENSIGLIVCRNLIHFFKDQEQVKFFELIKKMLKSGGQAIFTVNSVYPYFEEMDLAGQQFFNQSEETSFCSTSVLIHDRMDKNQGMHPCCLVYSKLTPCSDQLISHTQIAEYLYQKNPITESKWVGDKKVFKKLDKGTKEIVTERLKANDDLLKSIKWGNIRVVTKHLRAYNPNSLTALFQRHGLNVIETFIVNNKGHLIRDQLDAFKEGRQMGIVVSKD